MNPIRRLHTTGTKINICPVITQGRKLNLRTNLSVKTCNRPFIYSIRKMYSHRDGQENYKIRDSF